jgi:hypothetical protein
VFETIVFTQMHVGRLYGEWASDMASEVYMITATGTMQFEGR